MAVDSDGSAQRAVRTEEAVTSSDNMEVVHLSCAVPIEVTVMAVVMVMVIAWAMLHIGKHTKPRGRHGRAERVYESGRLYGKAVETICKESRAVGRTGVDTKSNF
eukprot:363815-Pleurochrysis_carterae.AAC.1